MKRALPGRVETGDRAQSLLLARWLERAPHWVNWSGDVRANPRLITRPRTLEEIRRLITAAEIARPPAAVRAVGAGWSFSAAATTDGHLLDMRACDAVLTHVITEPDLVHVEAGITLWTLHRYLEERGRALIAIPGGSGQTLGGAISTATHGADAHLPPLVDAVRAVHLIGAGGVEYWIEGDRSCVDPAWLAAAYPGIRVIREPDALHAVTVSVGRFGVTYSVVLDTVASYWLRETRTTHAWPDVADWLADDAFRRRHRSVQVLIDPYPDDPASRRAWLTTRSVTTAATSPNRADSTGRADSRGPLRNRAGRASPMLTWPGLRSGRAGAAFIAICNAANRIGMSAITRAMVRATLNAAQRTRTVDDVAYRLAAGPPDAFDCCRGSSLEMFFDANTPQLRTFIDQDLLPTVADIGRRDPVPCWIAIRLTAASQALLAMQRWPTTAAVEVAVLRGARRGPELLTTLESLAVRAGATIHWGQRNNLRRGDVTAMYPGLSEWRRQLAVLSSSGGQTTFASAYCTERGLDL